MLTYQVRHYQKYLSTFSSIRSYRTALYHTFKPSSWSCQFLHIQYLQCKEIMNRNEISLSLKNAFIRHAQLQMINSNIIMPHSLIQDHIYSPRRPSPTNFTTLPSHTDFNSLIPYSTRDIDENQPKLLISGN